jgi:hypothetical protein
MRTTARWSAFGAQIPLARSHLAMPHDSLRQRLVARFLHRRLRSTRELRPPAPISAFAWVGGLRRRLRRFGTGRQRHHRVATTRLLHSPECFGGRQSRGPQGGYEPRNCADHQRGH